MGCQNVVDSIVGIGGSGQVVSTLVQNVGLCAVSIVGSQITLVDLNGKNLGRAGSQLFGLAKAHQLHCGLLDLVVDVILGIGRGQVDLNGLLAFHVTGVGNLYGNVIALLAVLVGAGGNGHIAVLEGGVGQTVTEGKGNFLAILGIIVTGITLTHNRVKVSGLVVLVAYVDAFLVYHVGGSLIGHLAVKVRVLQRQVVVHCGGRQVVVAVGIHQAAGGVNLAGQDIGNRIGTGNAQAADPQAGIHIVVVQEVHLQGVGGVDQNDDAGDLAFLLQAVSICHQCPLSVIQRQVVELGGHTVAVHIAGECAVIALAAHAGEGDDDGIAVGSDGVLDLLGIVGGIDLGDGGLAAQGGIFAAGAAFGCCCLQGCSLIAVIPIPQSSIDLKAALFQSCLQVVCLGCVNVTGTGTAIGQVHGVDGQSGNLGAGSQGQRAVVGQQCGTLSLYFIAESLTCRQSFVLRNAHTGVVNGILILVFQFPEAVAGDQEGDGVVEHSENDIDRDQDHSQDRTDERNSLPERNVLTLCFFVSLFRLLVAGFQFVHCFSSFFVIF